MEIGQGLDRTHGNRLVPRLIKFVVTASQIWNPKKTPRKRRMKWLRKSISTVSVVFGKNSRGISPHTRDGFAAGDTAVVSHRGQGPRDLWFFILLIYISVSFDSAEKTLIDIIQITRCWRKSRKIIRWTPPKTLMRNRIKNKTLLLSNTIVSYLTLFSPLRSNTNPIYFLRFYR